MRVENRRIELNVPTSADWLTAIAPRLMESLGPGVYPLRFCVAAVDREAIVVEAAVVSYARDEAYTAAFEQVEILAPRRKQRPTDRFGVVQVVPTGIRCDYGGYAGDSAPAANLLAAAADFLVTHPNAVNASDLNEMAPGILYVEGKMLDDFCLGYIGLQRVPANRVGTVIDPSGAQYLAEVQNLLDAARASAGIDCARHRLLKEPLGVRVGFADSGSATGSLDRPDILLSGVEELIESGADAVGGVSVILGVEDAMFQDYLDGQCPNPSGAVEAIVTHLVSKIFRIPSAHAPLPYYQDAREGMSRNPRAAAEFISRPHYFCVLKGLHRAPRPVALDGLEAPPAGVITLNDIGAVVAPASALGGIPMLASAYSGIPIIAVRENHTILDVGLARLPLPGVIEVGTYLEAAGVITALRNGIPLEALRRPLTPAADHLLNIGKDG